MISTAMQMLRSRRRMPCAYYYGITMLAAGGPVAGKAAFIGVFVLLLIWLLLMPGRLIGHADRTPPWWRNTRFWAVVVTLIQIAVYLRWG